MLSTLYLDRPEDSTYERDFGLGYYRRKLRAEGLTVTENTYAPYGDDPLLLHDVTIRNDERPPRKVSWFEYWDVNPYNRANAHNRQTGSAGVRRREPDADRRADARRRRHEADDALRRRARRARSTGFETSVDALLRRRRRAPRRRRSAPTR